MLRLPTLSPHTLSIIVPCFNEAEVLPEFHRRLAAVMDALPSPAEPWTVLYVNDGSRDGTLRVIDDLRRQHPQVASLNLSRNFGKEAATTAGLDAALQDPAIAAVVVIDADLQDPPEVIPALIDAWRGGFDMVYAQRRERRGDTWLKKTSADLFYRLMERLGRVDMPRDTGDFRLMSRRVVDALGQLRERHRFMKGLFAWVGYPTTSIRYDRAPREAGTSKWSYWRLWNLALEGITGYTVAPLTLATYTGMAVALMAIGYGILTVIRTAIFGNEVPGYPSLLVVVLFLGGVQLVTLGIIGEYLGRIFNETKARPLYLVESYRPATGAPALTQPGPASPELAQPGWAAQHRD